MNGKEKCKVLKQIRRDIANANGIALEIPECPHKGDCLGTCPRCESEVRYLEKRLAEKRCRGIKVAVAGVSAGLVALSATACNPITTISELINASTEGDMAPPEELMGDVPLYSETEIQLDGEIAVLPDTDTANDTAPDTDGGESTDVPMIPGDLRPDAASFDDTEGYELAGAVPLADNEYEAGE